MADLPLSVLLRQRFGALPDLRVYYSGVEAPRGFFEASSSYEALEACSLQASLRGTSSLLWWEAGTEVLPGHWVRFAGELVVFSAPEAAQAKFLELWGFSAVQGSATVFCLTNRALWLKSAVGAGVELAHPDLGAQFAKYSQRSSECLALGGFFKERGDKRTALFCWQRAVALDRSNLEALLALADHGFAEGDRVSACLYLEEAARIEPLDSEREALRQNLASELKLQPSLQPYYRVTGRLGVAKCPRPRRLLMITNLFPPDELGGYGRMMWEFAFGLVERGHDLLVASTDAVKFRKEVAPEEWVLEPRVRRTLRLMGTWEKGAPLMLSSQQELLEVVTGNGKEVEALLDEHRPELVILGNLDMLHPHVLSPMLTRGLPLLHALANAAPGFNPEHQPKTPRYWMAPCSDWNGLEVRRLGFSPARLTTLYPGGRVDRFFRQVLPSPDRLRICYASLVMPYKGAHILVGALDSLHRLGVDFTAEIAGDCPDPRFLDNLRQHVARVGMDHKVTFSGFLNRKGLAALFARSNVLVFPSQFAEPFGISQVEAMASGLVVVSSGTGGAKEIVQNEVSGFLFQPQSPDDLAKRLYFLARKPEKLRELALGAQRRANDFSVDKAVLKIEALVEQLLASFKTKA